MSDGPDDPTPPPDPTTDDVASHNAAVRAARADLDRALCRLYALSGRGAGHLSSYIVVSEWLNAESGEWGLAILQPPQTPAWRTLGLIEAARVNLSRAV